MEFDVPGSGGENFQDLNPLDEKKIGNLVTGGVAAFIETF